MSPTLSRPRSGSRQARVKESASGCVLVAQRYIADRKLAEKRGEQSLPSAKMRLNEAGGYRSSYCRTSKVAGILRRLCCTLRTSFLSSTFSKLSQVSTARADSLPRWFCRSSKECQVHIGGSAATGDLLVLLGRTSWARKSSAQRQRTRRRGSSSTPRRKWWRERQRCARNSD